MMPINVVIRIYILLATKVWQCTTNMWELSSSVHSHLVGEEQGRFGMQLVVRQTPDGSGTSSTLVWHETCFPRYLSDFSIQSTATDLPSSSSSTDYSTSQPTSFPPTSLELVFVFSYLISRPDKLYLAQLCHLHLTQRFCRQHRI